MGLTENGFLDNQLTLQQPAKGFRAGSDAVLAAAAVPAKSGERVLDAGAGAGAIALCLAWRVAGLAVEGLEIQPELAELARRNAKANGLAGRVAFHVGDLGSPPKELTGLLFDHVVSNPPYYRADRAQASPDGLKAQSHMEGELTLGRWIDQCLALLRPGGTLTLIHRIERLGDILEVAADRGAVILFPLWPRLGAPARQVIVRITKGGAPACHLDAGLVLHEADGAFTPAADDILRGRSALALGQSAE